MTISAADILPFATPVGQAGTPGILDQVRNRLEWTWGLGHGNLDEHLRAFADPQCILTDATLLIIPQTEIIREIWYRHNECRFGVRRPRIQKVYKNCHMFEYLVLPVDPSNATPSRMWVSEVPPHLVLCTTSGKIMKAWGHLAGDDHDAVQTSFIERSNAATHNDPKYALTVRDLDIMHHIYSTWSWIDHVPQSFLSEDSDVTMVESDEEWKPLVFELHGQARSASSSDREPKRRLLPCELEEDPNFLAIDDNSDDLLSSDSHITGVDDPEEFAKASMARGDYETDRSWLKGIESWAEGASSGNDEEILLNDDQIEEDPKEQPRVAMSLDLAKPDYLQVSRHKKTTATGT
ncbi:hypothetical protein C8R43DRAFT_1237732 [Mycena crocata]|nr:hypothetical protein C8R43DRAFT_1237732 [Mycena crocata]